MGLGLGLRLGLGGAGVLGPALDPDAAAWFAAVEAAGSVYASGAKTAYDKFIKQLKSDNNFAAFNNGMLLSFAGFTGLPGCFIPITSRGGVLPINVGFVAGHKTPNGLQGNGSAYIDCGIGYLSAQQNNQSAGVFGAGPNTTSNLADIGNAFVITGATAIICRNSDDRVRVASSSTAFSDVVARVAGFRLLNRLASNEYRYLGAETNTVFSTASDGIVTTNMTVFARGGSGATTRILRMSFWGDALPNPIAFRTACNELMTELGV